ncbi:MAG: hypothetical protein AB7G48_10710 [Nitrospiraceae bacterium]
MRVRPVPASMRYPKLRFALTDHPITVWAGAILLRLSDELIGLRAALITLLTPFAKSPDSQIPAINVLLVWWYGLALEAERFEHFTHYRRDLLLPRLPGLPRFPSPDTLRRFFHGFTYQRATKLSEASMGLSLDATELGVKKKARKGGSFLCTDQYCVRYLAGGRGKGEPNTGTNHLRFRLVQEVRPKMSACA